MLKKLVVLSAVGLFAFTSIENPKRYTVSLPLEDWNKIITYTNDAPVPGADRNPILQQLQYQLSIQIKQENDSLQKKAKEDSIKTKKPDPKATKKGE